MLYFDHLVIPPPVNPFPAVTDLLKLAARVAVAAFPVTLPDNVAVIVPAVKLPLVPLATIVPEVVPEDVALEVTVNVAAPELLYDVEPDNPVPEVLSVSKLLRVPTNVDAVIV